MEVFASATFKAMVALLAARAPCLASHVIQRSDGSHCVPLSFAARVPETLLLVGGPIAEHFRFSLRVGYPRDDFGPRIPFQRPTERSEASPIPPKYFGRRRGDCVQSCLLFFAIKSPAVQCLPASGASMSDVGLAVATDLVKSTTGIR